MAEKAGTHRRQALWDNREHWLCCPTQMVQLPVSVSSPRGGGLKMPRPRQRACLQHGLKLDLNRLARQGLVNPGAQTGPFAIRWTNTYWQEEIAIGLISADMQGEIEGSLRIQIGELDQTIILIALPRHYGGRQWYFMCPSHELSSLGALDASWAGRFASRDAWPGRVAYSSQFMTADERAHLGKSKIKSRLIGNFDPDEWDLPPKPKWMRWKTYNRYVERFERYEDILNDGIIELMANLMGRA